MSDSPHARLAALADPTAAPADQLPRLRKLLETVLRADYKRRKAPFGNLFQAIGGACYALELDPSLRAALQDLRVAANLVLHESYPGTPAEVAAGFAAVAELLGALTGEPYAGPRPPAPSEILVHLPAAPVALPAPASPATTADPRAVWRVQVLHADLPTSTITVEMSVPADGRPLGPFQLELPAAYEGLLLAAAALHPALNLIGPVVLPDGRVRPRRVVLEPDYLISVTTLAECAQRDGTYAELALLKAFLPDEPSRSLVVGNLVNRLLDEEVSHAAENSLFVGRDSLFARPDALAGPANAGEAPETDPPPTSNDQPKATAPEDKQQKTKNEKRDFDLEHFLTKKLFRAEPLTLSTLAEFQTRTGVPELLNDLRRHHRTLRLARQQGFAASSRSGYQQQPLRLADCFLEPTFLSATYGLQGRLDLLHESPTGYDLVELKSSVKVPAAEPWTNHAAQAQLYRLLLESVFGADGETAGRGRTSILYSNATEDQPAVRPVVQNLDFVDQLLAARNQLVGLELQLARATGPGQVAALLAPVLRPNLAAIPPFNREKAEKTASVWAAADRTERAYCLELTRFAAREMRLALLGDESRPGDAGGQAGLWLLPQARKHQNFSLLDELELVEDHSNAPDDARDGLGPHLIFQRPAGGREVNFRAGDTLILYPRRKAPPEANADSPIPSFPPSLSVLDAQVVKVTLAEDLGADGRVVLAVRNRRMAPRYLHGHSHWALEPDTYDTFRREWAGLTAFLSLPPARRRQLLARTAPRPPQGWDAATAEPATAAPEVVARALDAPDWFVLCGPPGTGKTRSVLRELAVRLVAADKNTLLAAYTNRAVDEICEQLIDAGLPFIRIGSRLSTSPAYRPYLLDNMIRDLPTRQMVRARLTGTPLYVGTISSLLGRPELFQLKQFDVAVVDEASQVLEGPMLALLAKAKKFILIGDHRQLPAVVTQEPEASAVAPAVADLLREQLGLSNLRNSYFERLFRRAEAHWPYAHGTLANQHRAHAELASLVNDDFYGGQLRSPAPWQHASLNPHAWPAASPADAFGEALRRQRLVFVPTRRQPDDLSQKESSQEAELAARAALAVVQGYGAQFEAEATLGIIASYRNQAARIRARLAQLARQHELPQLAQVSVDTVERYQGSQREVIIVSFCCHHEHQLELMVSPDETGQVDRKLNVAVTRARQQLVLLGNELVLSRAPHHAALLARVRAGGGWVNSL